MRSQSSGHYIWKKAHVYVLVKNAMSTKKTRNTLTPKKKCELIEFANKNPQLSSRTLAEKFGCGKTQVTKILSKKESLVAQYESNVSQRLCSFEQEVSSV